MEVTGQTVDTPHIPIKKAIHAFRQYGANTTEEYEQKLNNMSTWALAEEAQRHHLRPTADRKHLVKTLLKEFAKVKTSHDNLNVPQFQEDEEKKQKVKEMFKWMR